VRRRTDVRSRSRNPGRRTCAAGLPLRSPSATRRSRPGVPIPSIGAVVARELDPSAGRSATRRGGGRPLTRRPITPWRPDCVSATPLRVPPPALGRSEATVPLVLTCMGFPGRRHFAVRFSLLEDTCWIELVPNLGKGVSDAHRPRRRRSRTSIMRPAIWIPAKTYFRHWLAAFVRLVAGKEVASGATLARYRGAWDK